jgi:hypothetical protein
MLHVSNKQSEQVPSSQQGIDRHREERQVSEPGDTPSSREALSGVKASFFPNLKTLVPGSSPGPGIVEPSMFMSCDRFKSNSGKSFAGQSVTLARVAFEHACHIRRPHSVCVTSSGRRWATATAPILSLKRTHDHPLRDPTGRDLCRARTASGLPPPPSTRGTSRYSPEGPTAPAPAAFAAEDVAHHRICS